jgi:hypothetical protein
VSLWESVFPAELLMLPAELGPVDALLDDPVFFAPFAPVGADNLIRADQAPFRAGLLFLR